MAFVAQARRHELKPVNDRVPLWTAERIWRNDRIWHFSDLGRCPTKSAKWAKADVNQVAVTNRDFMSTRLSSRFDEIYSGPFG
jgi:hypothetical protein